MVANKQNFDDLEKQLAKDALEQALKNLHGVINKEIEQNKKTFSEEIQKTLSEFRENLEKNVSEEIDKKLVSLFEDNFYTISQGVKKSFETSFDPVLENTKNDMKRLHIQGEQTLNSWGKMMSQYEALWNKPFFVVLASSILTGMALSFLSSYYLTRNMRETMRTHEELLAAYKILTLDYFEREKAGKKEKEEKGQKTTTQQTTSKKKK